MCVLLERCVIFCVIRVFLCCLIVVSLPPGKYPFAVQLNNNNNNNNNIYDPYFTRTSNRSI
jgi:hypothetical protein